MSAQSTVDFDDIGRILREHEKSLAVLAMPDSHASADSGTDKTTHIELPAAVAVSPVKGIGRQLLAEDPGIQASHEILRQNRVAAEPTEQPIFLQYLSQNVLNLHNRGPAKEVLQQFYRSDLYHPEVSERPQQAMLGAFSLLGSHCMIRREVILSSELVRSERWGLFCAAFGTDASRRFARRFHVLIGVVDPASGDNGVAAAQEFVRYQGMLGVENMPATFEPLSLQMCIPEHPTACPSDGADHITE